MENSVLRSDTYDVLEKIMNKLSEPPPVAVAAVAPKKKKK
jgi:hypothetical protein